MRTFDNITDYILMKLLTTNTHFMFTTSLGESPKSYKSLMDFVQGNLAKTAF